jgi:hypothetical protein
MTQHFVCIACAAIGRQQAKPGSDDDFNTNANRSSSSFSSWSSQFYRSRLEVALRGLGNSCGIDRGGGIGTRSGSCRDIGIGCIWWTFNDRTSCVCASFTAACATDRCGTARTDASHDSHDSADAFADARTDASHASADTFADARTDASHASANAFADAFADAFAVARSGSVDKRQDVLGSGDRQRLVRGGIALSKPTNIRRHRPCGGLHTCHGQRWGVPVLRNRISSESQLAVRRSTFAAVKSMQVLHDLCIQAASSL